MKSREKPSLLKKSTWTLLRVRTEFLELVGRDFFYFRCLLIDPHLHKSCPMTAYHHLWLCHITHLEAKNNDFPASTDKKLLKSLLEDGTLSPYLHIQLKSHPFGPTQTTIPSTKRLGHSENWYLSPLASFLSSPFYLTTRSCTPISP